MSSSLYLPPRTAPTGVTTHAQKSMSGIRVGDIAIPEVTAKEFVDLAQSQSGKVHPRYQSVFRTLVGVCDGKKGYQITDLAIKAATVLSIDGAKETFRKLQIYDGLGRAAKHGKFHGFAPTREQQNEFVLLVRDSGHSIKASNTGLVNGLVQLCQGGSPTLIARSAGLSLDKLKTHWRRIGFYTPQGMLYYYSLPTKITAEHRKRMDEFEAAREAQENRPVASPHLTHQLMARETTFPRDEVTSTDELVGTTPLGLDTGAKNVRVDTVAPEQRLLRTSMTQAASPALPPPAQSTPRLHPGTSAKNPGVPPQGSAVLSWPSQGTAPVTQVEMLEKPDSAFEDALWHLPRK